PRLHRLDQEAVPAVLDVRHHAGNPVPKIITAVLIVRILPVAAPGAALNVEVEPGFLPASPPAEVEAPESCGRPVGQARQLAVPLAHARRSECARAVVLGEAHSGPEKVAEPQPLLLVAGDLVAPSRAHVLEAEEIRPGCGEQGFATLAPVRACRTRDGMEI